MDAVVGRDNAGTKREFSPHSWIEQDWRDVPDLLPEPDSGHVFPLVENGDLANGGTEVDNVSVLRLLNGQVTKDKGTQLVELTHTTEDEKIVSTYSVPGPVNSLEMNLAQPLCNLTSVSDPCAQLAHGRDGDCATENGDSEEDKLQLLPLPKPKSQRRPGVILLGRGNSFSLGRSEVIFLHNTKPYGRKGKDTQQQNTRVPVLHSMSETVGLAEPNDLIHPPAAFGAGSNDAEPARPSPPPLSNREDIHQSGDVSLTNHMSRPIVLTRGRSTEQSTENSTSISQGSATTINNLAVFEKHSDKESTSDELAALWARAELVMAGKQRAVLDVLAQFGVGDGQKEGKDDEEEEEEEGVWQVVESKGYAVDR